MKCYNCGRVHTSLDDAAWCPCHKDEMIRKMTPQQHSEYIERCREAGRKSIEHITKMLSRDEWLKQRFTANWIIYALIAKQLEAVNFDRAIKWYRIALLVAPCDVISKTTGESIIRTKLIARISSCQYRRNKLRYSCNTIT